MIDSIYIYLRSLEPEVVLISVFCICLVCEWMAGKARRLHIHSWSDSINNFLVGGISFFLDMLFSMATLPLLLWLYDHAAFIRFDSRTPGAFLLLFLLLDFAEYWFHRLSHEVNLLWSAHVVHHQSSFFNLSVGLRTSFFVPLFNIFFYAVFPLLGFDPAEVLLVIFMQGMFQLLVHTELVGKLGWLEYVFVTPSAHRVHHGKNEIYIDKNYGKFFIVWDRLFGTYQEETERVQYGITTPLERNGPLYSILEPYRKLIADAWGAEDKQQRRIVLFSRPGFTKGRRSR